MVVGAGLAGLVTAFELEQRGHEAIVLEADPGHIGVRVRTARFEEGYYGEFGAMRIPTRHNLTRLYIQKFGLPLRPFVNYNPRGYYHVRGQRFRLEDEPRLNRLYELSNFEKDKSPFDLWDATVLRALRSLSDDERADLRSASFRTDGARALDRVSLEDLLRRSGLSDEGIEFLTVAWSSETSLQTAASVVIREENEETWSLDFDEVVGGLDRLPRAFAGALKSPVRNGARVTRIEQDPFRPKVAAWYTTPRGENLRVEGDVLICTVPLGVMSRIEFAPGLSGPKLRAVRQMTYDSATKVLMLARQRFWETGDGIHGGGSVTDLPIALTYYPSDNMAKNPAVSSGPGVLLASYSWAQTARRLAALPPAERHQLVLEQLAKVHPQLQNPAPYVERMASWSWDNHPFSAGAFCWFSPLQHEHQYRHLLAPEGRVYFAGEHASLTPTWQQGALESGLRAVSQILAANLWTPAVLSCPAMDRRQFTAALAASSTGFAARGRVRFGCQTRSYYNPVKDRARLLRALDDIAAAGYEGFETNQLCLAEDFESPAAMKEELAKRKLALFGLHLGAKLSDAPGREKARADAARVAKGIRALGGSHLVMSPAAVRNVSGAELQSAYHSKAAELTELSKICADQGVKLAVHNHLEETMRGWAEFRVLAEKTRPGQTWFVVDVGPSGLTGQDPCSFLSEYHARIAGIHVRDYKGEKQVRLGAGTVNLRGVAEALDKRQWKGWALVELEAGAILGLTVEQASRQALRYLREEVKLGA